MVGGRVQGVGFRAFTQREALRRGLKGWVRNLADGRVEIECEGSRHEVSAFIEAVRVGPKLSQPGPVDVRWISPLNTDTSFTIEY